MKTHENAPKKKGSPLIPIAACGALLIAAAIALVFLLNVERSYGYQILNGKRVPPRKQLIKIGLIFKFSFEELQRMLKIAGKEVLYARNVTDARVIYSIEHGLDYEKACEFIWKE